MVHIVFAMLVRALQVDPASGELLHVLEHEIRSVSHPSYPVGRDLAVET